jgi:hypothetical protein
MIMHAAAKTEARSIANQEKMEHPGSVQGTTGALGKSLGR